MFAEIRNFRGIESADLVIDPICLIAGRNGAGKSSILQAVAAATTGESIPFLKPGSKPGTWSPRILKKAAGVLTRDGQAEGSVTITNDTGKVSITWPSCRIKTSKNTPQASFIAAGLVDLTRMDAQAQGMFLINLLQAKPTDDDIAKALGQLGVSEKTIKRTVLAIKVNGWEFAEKKVREKMSQDKGQWRGVTGEAYGARKGEQWKPAGWTEELDNADLAQLQKQVEETRQTLESAIGQQAVGADEIARLEAAVCETVDLKPLEDAVSSAQQEYELAETELRKTPQVDSETEFPCPNCLTRQAAQITCKQCHTSMRVVHRSYGTTGFEMTGKDTVSEEERVQRINAYREAQERSTRANQVLSTTRKALSEGQSKFEAASKAKAQLEEAKTRTVTADQVAQARHAESQAKAQLQMVESCTKARKLHTGIQSLQRIADALALDGIRQNKLIQTLEPFNDELEALSTIANWGLVSLGEDLQPWYDGRPYVLLSESEKYRVHATLQIAIAHRDGSDMVILDGADILDQVGRNSLFGMLRSIQIPAIVAMTANKRTLVPDLASVRLGNTYWVENGTVDTTTQTKVAA